MNWLKAILNCSVKYVSFNNTNFSDDARQFYVEWEHLMMKQVSLLVILEF